MKKHDHSILICILDDGTRNVYVNGIHCFEDGVMLRDPAKLAQPLTLKALSEELFAAVNVADDAMITK